MLKFEVTILGCGSALPTTKHNQTSQVINFREKLFMIDCGEGTQLQFRKAKFKFSRLGHIFISHLHGDHCFGLIGLISTFAMLGRTADLNIHCPIGLKDLMMPWIKFFCKDNPFWIEFKEFDTKKTEVIYEDKSLTVSTIPLKHRMPCAGFLFQEKKRPHNINKEELDFYEVPTFEINRLRAGYDYITPEGKTIANSILTFAPPKPRSYAYCSDTAYYEPIIEQIKGVDLLFHEATFASSEALRAKQTQHSTAQEAATIATKAEVKKLVIGHFSARYPDEESLLSEALEVFPNADVADELKTFIIEEN